MVSFALEVEDPRRDVSGLDGESAVAGKAGRGLERELNADHLFGLK